MTLIIYIIFSFLYIIIGSKVKQWEVIKILGFPVATPQGYLNNPRLYNLARSICFLVVVTAVIFSPYRYSATVGFPILGFLWFFVNNRGINRGIQEYRIIMKKTCDYYEANPTEEGGDFYKEAKRTLELTDKQIYEMYKENKKHYNMFCKYRK